MTPQVSQSRLLERSELYRECLDEKREILKLKWIESEKAGCDIGFDRALLIWVRKHRYQWRQFHRSCRLEESPVISDPHSPNLQAG